MFRMIVCNQYKYNYSIVGLLYFIFICTIDEFVIGVISISKTMKEKKFGKISQVENMITKSVLVMGRKFFQTYIPN